MIRSASILILCGGLGLYAQETTTTANTPAGNPSGQSMTGVLMDASCSAISSSFSDSSSQAGLRSYSAPGQTVTSNDAVQNSSTSTSSVTHSGRSSPTEGIRNNSASTTGTTGTAPAGATSPSPRVSDRDGSAVAGQGTALPSDLSRTAAARAADERQRMGTNVTGSSQVAGSATAESSHIAGAAGTSTSTGATSGANSASALGTTGAATDSATAAPEGTRSRSAEETASTVRDKYADCMPKATTTSFAIHADGKLYILDPAGNDMVRQQMGNEAFRAAMTDASGQPKWLSVSVVGTPGANNTLSISSVRK